MDNLTECETSEVQIDEKRGSPPNNIASLLAEGSKSVNRRASARLQRIANGFQWRQAYERSIEYVLPLADRATPLTVTQIPNGEQKLLGTGTFVWPAAAVMCKYLEKTSGSMIKGKRVIELGSGTGICGLLCSLLSASEVCLTDQGQILHLLQENVDRMIADHGGEQLSPMKVMEYSWGEEPGHLNGPFDVVLVSDCVLPKLYPMQPLIEAVNAVLGLGEDSFALFSFEQRVFPFFDVPSEFDKIAKTFGLKREVIDISQHDSLYCSEELELWIVRRSH